MFYCCGLLSQNKIKSSTIVLSQDRTILAMDPLCSKKEARLEKKKRKLEALANVSKLNEADREASVVRDDGANSSSANHDQEPHTKRPKQQNTESGNISDTNSSVILSDADYKLLKCELNRKKRELKSVPKLRLKLFGDIASLNISASDRTPIFLTDIQHLIMYGLLGGSSPCIPIRWCHLEKVVKLSNTTVLLLDGISSYHFSTYQSQFETIDNVFEHKLEVIMPGSKACTGMINEMMMAPMAQMQRDELVAEHGSLEAAINAITNPVFMVNSIFPVTDSERDGEPTSNQIKDDEVFPRTQLLLSALQMVDEGYPLPLRGELANRYKDFVMTKDNYTEVSARSPMFGVDCEMCRTSAHVNELTRISIINEDHKSIYETLVCPQNKIVDYLTQYSGITPEMMRNVTKTLVQVQQDIRNLLPSDAILVGQSLHSDLMAMRMMHPYVIDTSVIFNISGERRRKSKLQTLAAEFLGEAIQKNPLGHDSIEDCSASLKLTKLKLQKGIEFGDEILANRRRFNERKQMEEDQTNSQGSVEATKTKTEAAAAETAETISTTAPVATKTGYVNKMGRSTAIVASSLAHSNEYERFIDDKLKSNSINADIEFIKSDTNKSAVRKTCEITLNHALTMTHLSVSPEMLADDKINKTVNKIDQWVSNVWTAIAPNSLFIVLFGSPNVAASGAAMLRVK